MDASCVMYPDENNPNLFNGSITIRFDKELYWVAGQTATGDPLPIHQKCSHANAVDAKSLAGSSGKIGDLDNASDGLTTVIRFSFEGLRVGSDIVFIESGLLASSGGGRTDKDVICTIKRGSPPNQSGMNLSSSYYYMEITWDGEIIYKNPNLVEVKAS